MQREADSGLCAVGRGRSARGDGLRRGAGCFFYYLTSFVNGFMNSVNKMTNVKAGQCFGAAKGSLINYLEATFLSLALVFMTSDPSELAPSHVFSVPAWAYLGAICGLVAMVLIIVGTLHTRVLVSADRGARRQPRHGARAGLCVLRPFQLAARDPEFS
ncbi:MAG: DMT family transporter [Oscillospiraceae bacterium]